MFPEKLKESNGPDVIINSYSTNDGSTMLTFDLMRRAMENFIRAAALESKACDTLPLVISMDDYLGNAGGAKNRLSEELEYAMSAEQLARWYDTVAISYADVVRDIVYKDTSDATFFTHGNVHFGHLAHQTVAWSVAFAFLELLDNYCIAMTSKYCGRQKYQDRYQPLPTRRGRGRIFLRVFRSYLPH